MRLDDQTRYLLSQHQPIQGSGGGGIRASVAIVFRQTGDRLEFLMMQRSSDPRDPWSGQMSFPGGKIDPDDKDAKHAAVREAQEEVGLDLSQHRYLGQLNDFIRGATNRLRSVQVSPFVFELSADVALVGNYEVADLVWVDASVMNTPSLYTPVANPQLHSGQLPGLMLNEHKGQILWGLSLRLLLDLYSVVGWQACDKLAFNNSN